ncbi:MAG: hypothetical protein ACOYO1_14255 [Bacteroidales bacterium]
MFLNFLFGCYYYKVKTAVINSSVINQAQNEEKYIILHQGSNLWHLKEITINDETKEMKGSIETLAENYKIYTPTNYKGSNRYRLHEGNPTYEVHIYISEYIEGENSQITVPLSSVNKIEIYDTAIGTTIASHVFTTIGVIVGAFVILAVIIALTKSSCPFVYISDGNSFHFTGEMYGGAIFSSLERDDYMPLPDFKPSNNEYKLKISNELLERQYTNIAELMVVEHPGFSKVIIDKYGKAQTIIQPENAMSATSDSKTDVLTAISKKDNNYYSFNDDNQTNKELSKLIVSYKKPLNAKTAKLIINAKNSCWLDYLYGKFNELFGEYYNKFAESQKKVSAKKNTQWSLEQGIPLSVYIETDKGWEFVDYFNAIGPLATRDMIMPVDISKVKGDNVKIKLECGFMFWDIDYIAIDFSENLKVNTSLLSPSSAIDEKGNEVASLLSKNDDKYLIQADVGNEVVIKYPVIQSKKDFMQTVFLHNRGYYEYIRDYKGKPDLLYLNTFKKKGSFVKFSKLYYNKYIESNNFYETAINYGIRN